MQPVETANLLAERFGSAVLAALPEKKHPRIHIWAEHWPDVAAFCRNDPRLAFDWLACTSGVDYIADGQMAMVFDLWSFSLRHRFAVKVFCDRAKPRIPSVSSIWPAANWHEREAFDLFGIDFPGHPDLRRILLADDWEGYPLRKDYVFPREYHGIPGTVEFDFQPKITTKKPKTSHGEPNDTMGR